MVVAALEILRDTTFIRLNVRTQSAKTTKEEAK